MEPTVAPDTFIESRDEQHTVYVVPSTGERWYIDGTCNRCGLCEVGVSDPERVEWHGEPGTPGACTDLSYSTRLDSPVRPEISEILPGCTLHGAYLP